MRKMSLYETIQGLENLTQWVARERGDFDLSDKEIDTLSNALLYLRAFNIAGQFDKLGK